MIRSFDIIKKEIVDKISDELNRVGVHYKLFGRVKDIDSIKEKIRRKKNEGTPYECTGRKIQDVIGIRVVTYFKDDVELVKEILNKKIEYVGQQIDEPELTVFSPKRTNLICSFNDGQKQKFDDILQTLRIEELSLIDTTFELQLRTILSEGWHEVDHSLRYKCKSDWDKHKEKERMLNGIYASLETSDITLKTLFEDLSYQHFKNKQWGAMIRTKFRLRFQLTDLNDDFIRIFDEDTLIAKEIFKLDRIEALKKIAYTDYAFPVNINNILYVLNLIIIKNDKILEITPITIKDYYK